MQPAGRRQGRAVVARTTDASLGDAPQKGADALQSRASDSSSLFAGKEKGRSRALAGLCECARTRVICVEFGARENVARKLSSYGREVAKPALAKISR